MCFPCDTGFCEKGMRSIRNGNNAEKESEMVMNDCCVVSVRKITGQMNPNAEIE